MSMIKPHAPAGATGVRVGVDAAALVRAEGAAPAAKVVPADHPPVCRRFASTSGREGVRFVRSRQLFVDDLRDDDGPDASR
jgi:hypothetical protein